MRVTGDEISKDFQNTIIIFLPRFLIVQHVDQFQTMELVLSKQYCKETKPSIVFRCCLTCRWQQNRRRYRVVPNHRENEQTYCC